eukprot:scaffold12056_cov146-Isochrysis_galbana.AAC.1
MFFGLLLDPASGVTPHPRPMPPARLRMMAMPVQQYGVQGYGMQPYQLPHAQALSQEGQPRVPRGYGRQQEHGGSQQHHQQRPRCGGSQSRAQQSAGDSKARPASQPAPALTAGMLRRVGLPL